MQVPDDPRRQDTTAVVGQILGQDAARAACGIRAELLSKGSPVAALDTGWLAESRVSSVAFGLKDEGGGTRS